MRRFSLASLVATALIAAGAWAAQSSHAAVTLGSDLGTEPSTPTNCSTMVNNRGCLLVTDVLPGRELVSPFDGVIVRWRARLGDDTEAQSIRIRVVRRFDADQFTVISSGQLQNIPAGVGTYTFPERLPIRSGEQVGGEADNGTLIEWIANVAGAHLFGYNPSPPDGGTTQSPTFDFSNLETTLNADVEPDADRDGFGDESQDKCVGTAGAANGCPSTFTIDKLKQKGDTKVKVTATVPGAGSLEVGSPSDPALASAAAKKSLKAVTKTLTATTKQQVKLTLKLTKSAIGRLDEAGKLKLKVKAVYTPVGGPGGSQTKKKKLKT